ncbi:hypothetical protein WJX72_004862 [[Myrmecia] bisecta]|uniref:ABC transporter domain-containing protein n=1 Tax=[Myrmecia] bisecta TaxID=41462 RepID=A0AAW1Q589_9CHLO
MAEILMGLTANHKRALAVVLLAGGLAGAQQVSRDVHRAQREQRHLCADLEHKGPGKQKAAKVAVDKVFFRRLLEILKICVPRLLSKEAGLIAFQGGLLLSRTWLTDYISRIEARAGRHLISQNFPQFGRLLALFAAVAVPAACVNSGLKYMQKRIQIAFMRRLTHMLHEQYCNNRAYYAASTLGGLTNADQRITEDVEKFAFTISELYSYTFKPLLDVIVFTRSLSRVMGYRGQLGLYLYYMATATMLRALSPPLALMTSQEAGLSGAFRTAHQRLVAHSEEIAYNDPPAGAAEQMILNQHLYRLLRHAKLSAFQRFIQQVFDGYFVKYFASVVALMVYAAPIYFKDPKTRGSRDDITQDYIRSMRLLSNTSRGVGDLVLVYKRLTGLAGHTSRVAELLEQVQRLSSGDPTAVHRELYLRNLSSGTLKLDGDIPEPKRLPGDIIKFKRVALSSPDGTPLVRDLTFDVPIGSSILIMGPNGSGKSSLFRVLAGLWPLQGGEITVPGLGSMFYLSQRPYLVSGSLRDQLLYPQPPRAVWAAATPAMRAAFMHLPGAQLAGDELEEKLCDCLEAVELEYLLGRGAGWDQVQNWEETLSGGEKQRLAMARLLFHRPQYAILDECTSAVSADGEAALYRACKAAGITMLSIGHRPALRQFHNVIIHFEGTQSGQGWHLERIKHDL